MSQLSPQTHRSIIFYLFFLFGLFVLLFYSAALIDTDAMYTTLLPTLATTWGIRPAEPRRPHDIPFLELISTTVLYDIPLSDTTDLICIT